jgi:hypothetical protein
VIEKTNVLYTEEATATRGNIEVALTVGGTAVEQQAA